MKCFQNVFYIDTHLGATEEKNRSVVIRNLLRKEKIIPPEEVKESYQKFLNVLFNLNKDILLLNFKIQENDSNLFLYHLGSYAFFDTIKKYLLNLQTGGIHQILKNNVMRKVIPFEFIKRYLFEWWISEVMDKTTPQIRNNYEMYLALVSYVQKIIFRIQKEFQIKYPGEVPIYENEKFMKFLESIIGPVNIVLVNKYLNLFKNYRAQ